VSFCKSRLIAICSYFYIIAGLSAGCALIHKADQAASDCDNTRDEIIKLSEQNKETTGFALVKIYEPAELSRNADELKCSGLALWSDGDKTRIAYRSYIDEEGERFIEYEVPD